MCVKFLIIVTHIESATLLSTISKSKFRPNWCFYVGVRLYLATLYVGINDFSVGMVSLLPLLHYGYS